MRLPKTRTTEIVVQNLGAELLVYDLHTHKAYTLNETLKRVYQSCDGKTSFDELKREYKFTDDFIHLALDELKKRNLLAEPAKYLSPFAGASRRQVIRQIGLASITALPLISSIVAPTAAHAASNGRLALNAPCSSPSECQSNYCSFTFVAGPPDIRPGTPAVYFPCPPVTMPGPPVNIGDPGFPLYMPGPPITTACPPILVSPGTPPVTTPGPSDIIYVCQRE